MSTGEIIVVSMGGIMIAIVLWKLLWPSPHNSGNPDLWQNGEETTSSHHDGP
jgi:hypothetical protein